MRSDSEEEMENERSRTRLSTRTLILMLARDLGGFERTSVFHCCFRFFCLYSFIQPAIQIAIIHNYRAILP